MVNSKELVGTTEYPQGAFLVPSERCSTEEPSTEYCGWACSTDCSSTEHLSEGTRKAP
jgi:hypothetical protein